MASSDELSSTRANRARAGEAPDHAGPSGADREAEEAFEMNESTSKWDDWGSATAARDAKLEARLRKPVPTLAAWFAHRNHAQRVAASVALVLAGLGIALFIFGPGDYRIEKDSGPCNSVLEQWISPYVPPALPAKPTLRQLHRVDLDVREHATCDHRRRPMALTGGALLAVGVVGGVAAIFFLRSKRTVRTDPGTPDPSGDASQSRGGRDAPAPEATQSSASSLRPANREELPLLGDALQDPAPEVVELDS
jgi:hypothetical protein